MSLILEALKKSEAKRRLGEAPDIGTPFTAVKRRRSPLPLIVLAILVLAGFGWWFTRAPQEAAPPPQATTSTTPGKPVFANVQSDATKVTAMPPSTARTPPVRPRPLARAQDEAAHADDPAGAAMPAGNVPVTGSRTERRAPPSDAPGSVNPVMAPITPGSIPAVTEGVPRPEVDGSRAVAQASAPVDSTRAPPPKPGNEPRVAAPVPAPTAAAPATAAATPPAPAPRDGTPKDGSPKAGTPKDGVPKDPNAPLMSSDLIAANAANATKPQSEQGAKAPLVPMYYELPFALRHDLPAITLSMHVYDKEPAQRFAVVNGERVVEGDSIKDDLTLREIRPDGLLLDFRGTVFFYPRPGR